jgi:glyoxylase-like metal-dependent hydrolase (beta-lactamase superfamily II)
MHIGDIHIRPVIDGYLTFPAPVGFPARDSPEFDAHRDVVQADGRWRMTLGGFLLRFPRQPERLVLVDAGSGPSSRRTIRPAKGAHLQSTPSIVAYHDYRGLDTGSRAAHLDWLDGTETCHGFMLQSLAELGVAREQITDVVLSHLHFDHIGWVSSDGAPTFPNATIRVQRRDLDHFLRPEQAIEDAFYEAAWNVMPFGARAAPVLDRIEPWDGDTSIIPGLNVCFAPGHTPGHSVFVLSSGEARGMLLGDVAHCPLQLTDPDFSIMADLDPVLADQQRERVNREIAGTSIAVAGAHFPGLRFGRLLEGKRRSAWMFVD